jgi:glycosyltransferase involved in cell wall biosynthesis
MLNKKLIVYDEKNGGEGYRLIESLKQFRNVAGSAGTPLVFSDQLLDSSGAKWKTLVDHFLYHQSVTNPLGGRPEDELVDFVNAKDFADYRTENLMIEKSAQSFATPRFSIVVPFRDRDDTLPLVVDAMTRIRTEKPFELILANDGSRGPLPSEFKRQLEESGIAWTIAHIPPSKHFRAGFARNVGASYAAGEVLVFIDSDILLPAGFFEDLEQQLMQGEVIQAKRWQIWRNQRPAIGKAFTGPLVEPNLFWNEFQTSSEEWMDCEQPWRWASTFCLAVERAKFEELGGFRLWYSTYGFEDTDFGLRAHRAGLRLRRSNSDVFHLSPHTLDGWKRDSRRARDNRLRLSARKYFLANGACESLPWLTHLMI